MLDSAINLWPMSLPCKGGTLRLPWINRMGSRKAFPLRVVVCLTPHSLPRILASSPPSFLAFLAFPHLPEPLFLLSGHQLPVAEEHRRDIPVVGIDPEDDHA